MGAQTPPDLSDEKAARMMAGLRDGRTLRTLYVRRAQFKTYCEAHPEHAQEALPLIEANAKSARLRKGERLRSKTHCKHGHSLADARIYFCKGYIKRDCRTCWKIRSKRGGAITTEVLGKVTAALEHGATIGSFTGAGRSTYLVMHSTFSRHRRENPEFDRFVSEATKDNKRKGQKLRFQRVRNAAVRDQKNDYHKIIGLMPSNLPPDIHSQSVPHSLCSLSVLQCIKLRCAWRRRNFSQSGETLAFKILGQVYFVDQRGPSNNIRNTAPQAEIPDLTRGALEFDCGFSDRQEGEWPWCCASGYVFERFRFSLRSFLPASFKLFLSQNSA